MHHCLLLNVDCVTIKSHHYCMLHTAAQWVMVVVAAWCHRDATLCLVLGGGHERIDVWILWNVQLKWPSVEHIFQPRPLMISKLYSMHHCLLLNADCVTIKSHHYCMLCTAAQQVLVVVAAWCHGDATLCYMHWIRLESLLLRQASKVVWQTYRISIWLF